MDNYTDWHKYIKEHPEEEIPDMEQLLEEVEYFGRYEDEL